MAIRFMLVFVLTLAAAAAVGGCKGSGDPDSDADVNADGDSVADADGDLDEDGFDGDVDDDLDVPPPDVNGTLREIEGIPLLTVWGTPEEMGYAYGFLLADQIANAFEDGFFVWFDEVPTDLTLESAARLLEERILWPDGYLEEMEAVIRGVEDALGALPVIIHRRIEGGSAPLSASMLALMNAARDLLDEPEDCCSAAVWGEETGDGEVRVGGNLQHDWDLSHAMQLVMIRQPEGGLTHVCSNTIGGLSCQRGMNEEGIVMMPQGAVTPDVVIDSRCYAGVHGRLALEQIGSGLEMDAHLVELFETHPRCGSSIFLFVQGNRRTGVLDSDQRAVVIEQDFHTVVPRYASNNRSHGNSLTEALLATNHFHLSETVNDSDVVRESNRRYRDMRDVLVDRDMPAISDVAAVMQACDERAEDDTQQTVYFEIDERLMFVAFRTRDDLPMAPYIPRTTLTWDALTADLEH